MRSKALFVNGYGAAEPYDGNYNRYLGMVQKWIEQSSQPKLTVYLAGGYTNRPDLTEAQAMRQWFESRIMLKHGVEFVLISSTTTARDNLKECRRLAGDTPIIVFCEYTRRHVMRLLAKQYFRQAVIMGVAFDARSLELHRRFINGPVKYAVEWAALRWQWAERLRLSMRRGHVMRARRATAKN